MTTWYVWCRTRLLGTLAVPAHTATWEWARQVVTYGRAAGDEAAAANARAAKRSRRL